MSLPRGIWVLGCVSLLMDVSSEMIHCVLPLFMMVQLGASPLSIGLLEGMAESTALIVKIFSGALSDYWQKRKPLALLGYGLGALSKPLFAMATSMGWITFARLLDRVGKGIRGAPRDALVADIAPPEQRGAAFGLRQSLDTVGAFCASSKTGFKGEPSLINAWFSALVYHDTYAHRQFVASPQGCECLCSGCVVLQIM